MKSQAIARVAKLLAPAMLALLAPAASAKSLRVQGRITTSSGQGAPNAVVQIMRAKLQPKTQKLLRVAIATSRTDAQGRFVFPAIEVKPVDLLLAQTTYYGAPFFNLAYVDNVSRKHLNMQGLQADPLNVSIPVPETTTDPVAISAVVHHLAIKSDGNDLKCIERYVWSSSSKKVFLGHGPDHVSIRLNLPQNAQDVQIDPKIKNAKLVKTGEGWGVSMPIPPNTVARPALIVNYKVTWPLQMPWSGGLELSKKVIYPTNFFFVAREPDDRKLQITAPTLQPDQEAPVPVGGKGPQVRIVNAIGAPQGEAPALMPGTNVAISIVRPVSPMFYGLCLFVGALLLAVPATIVGTRRRAHGQTHGRNIRLDDSAKTLEPSYTGSVYGASYAPAGGERLILGANTQPLIEEIARLDDAHAAGTLDENVYRAQRAARKAELMQLIAPT